MGSIRRLEPDEDDKKDGISFDAYGRMQYHPEFHPNHGTTFALSDLIYMCKYHDVDDGRSLSFAIGKTEKTVGKKVGLLKKTDLYKRYRNMSDEEWLAVEQAEREGRI